MDALIYIANGLYLLSYGVRDILYLRLLTVTAATFLTVYFGSRPHTGPTFPLTTDAAA